MPTPATVAAADPNLYDATLEQAVRAFQDRHGLTPDGAIGPGTRSAMNVPVEQRIDQMRVNLERARWTLHEIKGEFVLVDVRGFLRELLPQRRTDLDLEGRRGPR